MAKKQETTTMEIVPNTGELTSPLVIPTDDIEEAVVMEEENDPNNHPNFIESNTAAITLEELSEKSIVPTFADNTLTVSHQSFIQSVIEAGQEVLWLRNKKQQRWR